MSGFATPAPAAVALATAATPAPAAVAPPTAATPAAVAPAATPAAVASGWKSIVSGVKTMATSFNTIVDGLGKLPFIVIAYLIIGKILYGEVADAGLGATEVVVNATSSVVTTTGAFFYSGAASALAHGHVVFKPKTNCHIQVMEPLELVTFLTTEHKAFTEQCKVILPRSCDEFGEELQRAEHGPPQILDGLVAEWNAAAKKGIGMWCPQSNHLIGQACHLAFGSYLFCSLFVVCLFRTLWQRRWCWWYPKPLRLCQRKLVVGPWRKLFGCPARFPTKAVAASKVGSNH